MCIKEKMTRKAMEENVLEWENIFYEKLNEDKKIKTKYARTIDGLSGKATSGQLTAIMGVSGAGKTNLFEVLIGKISTHSKTSGKISYNGKERDWQTWIKKISYLEQDDIYMPELTIYESMKYSLKLLEPEMKHEALDATINKALEDAQILTKKDALINSLSGGERKRAMIALKLLGNVEILILDEPTTGLDSHNALSIVNNLKKIAKERNILVIMTVHQPGEALFNLFDKLIYITKNGTLYEGPVSSIDEFLKSHGIERMEKISISEFLFELFSTHPYPYEIKNFQPKAEEIVMMNRKKNEEARLRLEFSNKNNVFVDFKGVNFRQMSILIRRKIHLIMKSSYFILFLLIYFSIFILNSLNSYENANIEGYMTLIGLDKISDLSCIKQISLFIDYHCRKILLFMMYVFIIGYKLPFQHDVCEQEIFSGKYSVRTYFCSMMLFNICSFFLTNILFILGPLIALESIKEKVLFFITHLLVFFTYYFNLLPIYGYFLNVKAMIISIILLFNLLSVSSHDISIFYKHPSLFARIFKYLCWLFNLSPFFIMEIYFNYYFYQVVSESLKKNNLHDKADQILEDYIDSCDFLGYKFNFIFYFISIMLSIPFLIFISFIFTRRKVSSNIRLKLNK